MIRFTLFQPARTVPEAYRANFSHLYSDIAWFGVLSGSAMEFMIVFAARQGASPWQLGLISAGPALVNLAVALPVGRWLQNRPLGRTVFWASVLHRIFYLLWAVLPFVLVPQAQIWGLIGLVLLMSIPGAALAIGFNALYAAAVPPPWRGHVAGIRNSLWAMTLIVTALLCGQILTHLPFPVNYQLVFALGFLGAALSSMHLWFVRPLPEEDRAPGRGRSLGELGRPGLIRLWGDGLRPTVGLRFLLHRPGAFLPRPGRLAGGFGRAAAALFAFHFTQYLPIPLYSLYLVERLQFSDRQISLGNALFYLAVLAASTRLAALTQRLGNRRVVGLGAVLMSSYTSLIVFSQAPGLYFTAAVVGGLGWALVGGALNNYILETIPPDSRPTYLAVYNLAFNAAVLFGSLLGPYLAGYLGLSTALLVFAACRFLVALALLGRSL